MRKNKFFIAGLVTVFVALVSLTLVSSTWAKYTSTASGKDSARVAYWGFEQESLVLTDLFVNTYDGGAVTAGKDVIAPGTQKEITITYKAHDTKAPEVKYQLAYSISFEGSDVDLMSNLDAHPNFYWTYKGVKYSTCAELADFIAHDVTTHNPGTVANHSITLGWVWLFDAETVGATNQDSWDTILGNSAADGIDVVVTLTVVATQLDS